MNIKALITAALVIGSTSLAMADAPQGGVEVRDRDDISVRDHRYQPVYQAPAYQTPVVQAPIDRPPVASWGHPPIFMTLSSNDKIGRSGRDYIPVRSWKSLRTLKLQATGGKTFIDEVTIRFANGQTQTIDLDKQLENGCDATIDLTGNYRKVVSLTVTGRAQSRRASFAVLGA